MRRTRSSEKSGFPGGRRFATALVVSTLAGTGLAACGGEAEGHAAGQGRQADRGGRAGRGQAGDHLGRVPGAGRGNEPKSPSDLRDVEGAAGLPRPGRQEDRGGGLPAGHRQAREEARRPAAQPRRPGLGVSTCPAKWRHAAEVRCWTRYDLIGFDPRGVGHSTPQSCGLQDPESSSGLPLSRRGGSITRTWPSPSQRRAVRDTVGDNLRYFTTANTARDMDRIRQALGERKISYWGQSFGTYLGTVYSALFQDRTDRMVLEGNIDPPRRGRRSGGHVGQGHGRPVPRRGRRRRGQDGTLGLGDTVEQVTENYLTLADRLDRKPAAVPGTRLSLDGRCCGTSPTDAAAQRHAPSARPVLEGRRRPGRRQAPRTPTTRFSSQIFADSPAASGRPRGQPGHHVPGSRLRRRRMAPRQGRLRRPAAPPTARSGPLTAGMPDNIRACAYWEEAGRAARQGHLEGPRNTLILQNRRDNATPWEGGTGLHKALGDSSAFVGVDNGGHYVYNEGSACADKATVDFLTTGHLPGKNVYCTDVQRKR